MNVVVLDAGQLAGEPYFPMLNLSKYGWIEYPASSPEEAAERCWRADIIISVNMPIDNATLDKAYKLRLVVLMGEAGELVEKAKLEARGIRLIHVTGFDVTDPAEATKACRRVITKINAYLREEC